METNEKLGQLETLCTDCEGTGGHEEYPHDWVDCFQCSGAGYIPTKIGEKVLALIQHNLRHGGSWRIIYDCSSES